MEATYDLWAVISKPGNKPESMQKLATFSDWHDAISVWDIADRRRRAGMVPEVKYLAIRRSDDLDWQRRLRHTYAARITGLMMRKGSQVTVRIYGNDYRGRVVKSTLKSAEVRFNVPNGRFEQGFRVRPFRLLPEGIGARGVHHVSQP